MRPLIALLLLGLPVALKAQTFNTLHRYSNDFAFGHNIFIDSLASDGELPFVVFGWGQTKAPGTHDIFFMRVAADGKSSLVYNALQGDTLGSYRSVFVGSQPRMLPNGGFLAPLTYVHSNAPANALYLDAGLIIYNHNGDTVLTAYYNDQDSTRAPTTMGCDYLRSGGYVLVGADKDSGWFVRTDALAAKVLERHYPQRLNSLTVLSNNRYLISGSTDVWQSYVWRSPQVHHYKMYHPYFAIIDSMGAIVKDTSYPSLYSGSTIRKDNNNGYYHWGVIDTFVVNSGNWYNPNNFPSYLAHLDTNFRLNWVTRFRDGLHTFCLYNAKQLRDGSYVVLGFAEYYQRPGLASPTAMGWAARVSATGSILWSNVYGAKDSGSRHETMMDLVERADGTLVVCGSGGCGPNYCPSAVWTITLDTNGCEIPGCNTTTSVPRLAKGDDIKLYPNPARDVVTIANAAGPFKVYNSLGALCGTGNIPRGSTYTHSIATYPTGLYLFQFGQQVLRLLKE